MGKKTDAFTANLQTYSDQSGLLTAKLIKACQSVATHYDQFTKLEVAHNARSTEIIKKCGEDPNLFEPQIAKDPALNKLGDALTVTGQALMAARKDRDSAKALLTSLQVKLKKEAKAFSDYVTAKEKSKNPFKSKNSLPAAKGMVKCANDLITKNDSVLG